MLEIINSYAYQKGIPEDIYFAHGFQKQEALCHL